jgi:hypothetical protein
MAGVVDAAGGGGGAAAEGAAEGTAAAAGGFCAQARAAQPKMKILLKTPMMISIMKELS